mgnify:CR=1 FL=1
MPKNRVSWWALLNGAVISLCGGYLLAGSWGINSDHVVGLLLTALMMFLVGIVWSIATVLMLPEDILNQVTE